MPLGRPGDVVGESRGVGARHVEGEARAKGEEGGRRADVYGTPLCNLRRRVTYIYVIIYATYYITYVVYIHT